MKICKNSLPRLLAPGLLLSVSLLAAQQATAHGYMSEPPSRAYACRMGLNTDCGAAQYEPQSVGETAKGFPALGPVDGKFASGGNAAFANLDVQNASRWVLTEVRERNIEFAWEYAAAHLTTGWQYYITKADWNPNQPLTRASFDLTPFCSVEGGGRPPIDGAAGGSGPGKEKHRCTLPGDRDGQHVIFGVWTVADTGAAFYNVVDVDITANEGPVDGWAAVGTIAPTQALLPGDSVTARAFKGSSEFAPLSYTLNIASAEQGRPANWSFELASTINAAQGESPMVQAGVRDSEGNIAPVRGVNKLYAHADSQVTSYQLRVDMQEDASAYLNLDGVAAEYVLDKGVVQIPVTVTTNRSMNVQAALFDHSHKQVALVEQRVDASRAQLRLDVRSVPGMHHLSVTGVTLDGRTSRQANQMLTLSGDAGAGDYDHVFPNEKAQYKAGVTVLQEKNGKVYECKPFPFEGWCSIYSSAATQYEPGVGSNWQDAWIEK